MRSDRAVPLAPPRFALDGAGTIELGGATLDAVVYERQPFQSHTLFQTLAVAKDRWFVDNVSLQATWKLL